MTKRAENWPDALAAFIRERRGQAFNWRSQNCAFFACDWLRILMGVDPAAKYRKRCRGQKEALGLLKAGKGLVALAKADFEARGWQACPVAFARRGDIATTKTDHGEALGVVIGALVAHPGLDGLSFVPLAQCRRAWRID